MMSIQSLLLPLCFLTSVVSAAPFLNDQRIGDNGLNKSGVKLYAINCGTIDVLDMRELSSGGEYNGQTTQLVNPCFFIRHPKGDLLWDTGHSDSKADNVNEKLSGIWHSKLRVKLIDQLNILGVSATNIDYLALSHIHPDHAGNANKFIKSTFIVNELEHQYMFSAPIMPIFGEFYCALKDVKTVQFKTEHDVFNDGTVVIKSMPGHTPGSSVLLIRLDNAGNVLLSGDLYIHAKGRALNTMLIHNVDKQLTLASRNKFEALAVKENARVIIQHEKKDFERLPKFPEYLD
jgi:N-acyl homoserine lactone hydrolase